MALSGVVAYSLTAAEVIEFALRKINAIPIGQDVDVVEAKPILTELNLMLKGWETTGPHLWRVTDGSVAAVANTPSYSLSTDNPLRLKEVRLRYSDSHDMPMIEMSRAKYMRLPVKTSSGPGTQWYFDPQRSVQTLYVWPVLATVTTETFRYSYQRRFQICASLNDEIDVPEEWLETVGYCLAKRILPQYGQESLSSVRIEKMADQLLRQAKSFDRPNAIQLMPNRRPR